MGMWARVLFFCLSRSSLGEPDMETLPAVWEKGLGQAWGAWKAGRALRRRTAGCGGLGSGHTVRVWGWGMSRVLREGEDSRAGHSLSSTDCSPVWSQARKVGAGPSLTWILPP